MKTPDIAGILPQTAAEWLVEPLFSPAAETDVAQKPTQAVDVLRAGFAELETLPPESDISWHEESCYYNTPDRAVFGHAGRTFGDGSQITARLQRQTDPQAAGSMWHDALFVLLRTTHQTDSARSQRITYRVPKDESKLTCEPDRAAGMKILAALKLVDQIDFTREDPEELIGGLASEAALAGEGISPDLDPDIDALRGESPAYRALSDHVRQAARLTAQGHALGIETTRTVGPEEAAMLVRILRLL